MHSTKSEYPLIPPAEAIRYEFGSPEAGTPRDAAFPMRYRAPVPINLLGVRHAPSELNVLNDLLRAGGELPQAALDLKNSPDNIARLAVGGDGFAKAAAAWIQNHIDFPIHAAFCSPFVRTKETAGHLGAALGLAVPWKIDSRIGERSYGDFSRLSLDEKLAEWRKRREDVRYWTPPNGESMENTELDARDFLRSISTRYHWGNVLMVTHGEFLVALRSVIEYPSNERLVELLSDSPPNCGIVHYTRCDPQSGEIAPYYKWLRLVNPRGENKSWDGRWHEIERKSYSNEDLLAEASLYPRRFDFSTRK